MAFIALVPFLLVLRSIQLTKHVHKGRLSFVAGYVFGLLYMGATHAWLFELVPFSSVKQLALLFVLYSAYLAFYYAAASYIFVKFTRSLYVFPFIWIAFETLRSLGQFGNPNGVIGFTQAYDLWFLSYASISGVAMVSFVVLSINVVITYFMSAVIENDYRGPGLFIAFVYVLALLGLPYTFNWSQGPQVQPVKLALVQGNHSQNDKLNPLKRPQIRDDYIAFSKESIKAFQPDLLIWPETVSVGFNLNKKRFMSQVADLNTPILFGTARQGKQAYYNSALLVSSANIAVYDKLQLMPFGEYWPYKRAFQQLQLGNIIPGSEYSFGQQQSLLSFKDWQIGMGICLESLYAEHFYTQRLLGADFFVVLANGAWFHDSTINERHLMMSLFRAVENGVYLFQTANTGLSAVVSPVGEIIRQSDINERVTLEADLDIVTLDTPYLKAGESMANFSMGLMLLLCLKALVHLVRKR